MPCGKTHRNLTYALATLSLPLMLVLPFPVVAGIEAGVLLSVFINPDNDLHCKWWLKPFGYGLYKEAISHRRGLRKQHWRKMKWWEVFTFSHLPYTGTLLRFIPVMTLMLIAALALELPPYLTTLLVLSVFNGLGISDTLHVLADIITSEVHGWT